MDELKIRTLQNDLPQELISNEILTRLPVKSLIRFKCVSKRWKSTISDPLFAKSHLQFQHSSKQSLFINNSITSFYTFDYSGYDSGQMIPSESDFDTDDDSPFDQKGVSDVELPSELACEISPSEDHYYPSFVGSCDGLVCLNPGLDNLFLWNPVTRELRKIQNPPLFPTKEEFIGGFGHVSSVDDYKIVLWSQEIDSDRQQAHVLCLKDEKWREVDVLEGYIIESRNTGVLVHEIVFWCLFNKFGILCIVGFDLVAEKFVNVQVPDWIQSLENYSLSAMGGCLCVWREHRGILTIGTMKQYGDWGSWVKLHHFDTSMENVFLSMVSGFTRAGKLVIATLYGTVYLVDFSQNPPTLMTILKLSMGYDMLDYVQTLVSPFSTANVKDAVM